MEALSENDAVLFRSSLFAVEQAQATHQFIANHLGRVYKIPDGSQIDPMTGEIVRPTVEESPA